MVLTHTVGDDEAGDRIDLCALRAFSDILHSRKRAKKLVKDGRILLDDVPVESTRRVKVGQQLTCRPGREHRPDPYELDVRVLYADRWLAVVEKPPGLHVLGHRRRTLERALPGHLPEVDAVDALPWPRPVHRLDMRTGGLVIAARRYESLVQLGRAFQERRVVKRYEAFVAGSMSGEGEVDTPVGGRPARSRYRAAEVFPSRHHGEVTRVELWPESGRTHQLRIHVASLGHPIVGDDVYTPAGDFVLRKKGLFLWACELRLEHPGTGEPLAVRTELPNKFAAYRTREARAATR